MNAFVLNLEPISYNNRNVTENYKTEIRRMISKETHNFLNSKLLYVRIYYFYNHDKRIDADNMSKLIVDAMSKLIYSDDRQVIYRIAAKVNLKHSNYQLGNSNIDINVLNKLLSSFVNKHTLYIEVDSISKYIPMTFGEPV